MSSEPIPLDVTKRVADAIAARLEQCVLRGEAVDPTALAIVALESMREWVAKGVRDTHPLIEVSYSHKPQPIDLTVWRS